MNKETGGAAFPRAAVFTSAGGLASVEQDGMVLRDHFAGLAMQGFASTLGDVQGEPYWGVIARDAYKLADAMLEARK